jgi:hypothetical protein
MRWLKELLDPALKCQRVGHSPRHQTRGVYERPKYSYRAVADNVLEQKCACGRCGHVVEDWHEVDRTPLDGLTMPDDLWRKFRADGRLVHS